MEGIELSIQTRAFPSHGRGRVHESVLPFLGVKEGDAIEVKKFPISEDEKPKMVTISIFADTMVERGTIRMSPEDIAKLAAAEGETVNVQRKIPITETISNKASQTGKAVQEGAKDIGAKIMPPKKGKETEPGAKAETEHEPAQQPAE